MATHYHCQHGLNGFDEHYTLERKGEQLSWQLSGEFKAGDANPMDDSGALAAGHSTISLLQPQMNHPQGLSIRTQQRISDALIIQLISASWNNECH